VPNNESFTSEFLEARMKAHKQLVHRMNVELMAELLTKGYQPTLEEFTDLDLISTSPERFPEKAFR